MVLLERHAEKNQKLECDHPYLTAPCNALFATVIEVVQFLIATRSQVELTTGSGETHAATLRAISPERQVVVLKFCPEVIVPSCQHGEALSLCARIRGRQFILQGRYVEPLIPRGGQDLLVRIGTSFVMDRPRLEYRVWTARHGFPAVATLSNKSRNAIQAQLVDVSPSGLCIETSSDFPHFFFEYLTGDKKAADCSLEIGDQKISCEVELIDYDGNLDASSRLLIGARIIDFASHGGRMLEEVLAPIRSHQIDTMIAARIQIRT